MNKYAESFERLCLHTEQLQKFQVMDCPAFNKGSYEEDKKLIGELVEKATPKKPRYNKKIDEYTCIECGYKVLRRREKMNYCMNCGQAIDWGEEND